MPYEPSMTKAKVLYDNFYARGTVTYSGTPISGFEPVNAYDWRDFTIFRMDDGQNLEVNMGGAEAVTTFVLWVAAAGSSGNLKLQRFSGSWADVVSVGLSGATMIWSSVSMTYARYRIVWEPATPGATIDIRQVAIGSAMEFPIGQWADVSPPELYQGVILQNIASMNGSILGRNIKRIEKNGKLSLNLLDPAWVRSTWDPFAIHAARKAFFWQWDPAGHAQEIAFAVATEINAPTNDRPPPRMKVEMPIRFLTQ